MSAVEYFAKHPVFRYEEFAHFMALRGITKVTTVRQQLSHHVRAGNLIRIKKELYASKSKYHDASDVWIDPYLIAGKASPTAIISHHSALEIYGHAYTTFNEITFLSESKTAQFKFRGQTFRSLSPNKVLMDKKLNNEFVTGIERENIAINVVNLERCIVDLLARPDISGGWEELWRSLNNIIQFDVDELIRYTLLLENATIAAKVGFFLEHRPKHLSIDEAYLKQLESFIPKSTHYMERSRTDKSQYFKRWHLMVPLDIVNQSWEEYHANDD